MNTINTDAEQYRILQAKKLLESNGFFQRADGKWYPSDSIQEMDAK